jgi:hypothetical protein
MRTSPSKTHIGEDGVVRKRGVLVSVVSLDVPPRTFRSCSIGSPTDWMLKNVAGATVLDLCFGSGGPEKADQQSRGVRNRQEAVA